MKQIVADTNTLISALGWKGNEYNLILKIMQRKFQLCLSLDTLNEFKEVALRPKFGFSAEETDEFIEALIEVSDVVVPEEKINVIKDDPADNIFLECALEAKADYIVSGDKHLLKLKEFKGIKIIKTQEALKLI